MNRKTAKTKGSTNNGVGIDSYTFTQLVSGMRWEEVRDFDHVFANDADSRFDACIARFGADLRFHAEEFCGTCGPPPDVALMLKEWDDGPVGKLGPYRPRNFQAWLILRIEANLKQRVRERHGWRSVRNAITQLDELVLLSGDFRETKDLAHFTKAVKRHRKAHPELYEESYANP